MKIKDIARDHGFNETELLVFLQRSPQFKVSGVFAETIPDESVNQAVEQYKVYLEEQQKIANQKMIEQMEREQREYERQQGIAAVLITSCPSFDGYTITKYSGFVSGDNAVQLNRNDLFHGDGGKGLMDALSVVRIRAVKELKEAAYDLGCNAVVGVDFDYITFDPESIQGTTHYYEPYVICVTANGNAVVIEKN